MRRSLLALAFIIIGSTMSFAQQSVYFLPQIADGVAGGTFWKTTIYLTNPAATGGATASGSLTFTNSAGQPFNVAFVDSTGVSVGAGNVIPFQIAPGQSRKYVSRGTAPLSTGYAAVSTNLPIAATAIFSLFAANGQLISEAGVPQAQDLRNQAIVVDTLGGFNTGVAYANTFPSAATISLQLLNADGVAVMPSTTQTLPASGHRAAFVTELFSGAPAMYGTMQISSETPLAAVALRFDPTFTFFTTLPAITLTSFLPSAFEWLDQRPWFRPLASLAHFLGGIRFTRA